MTHQLNASCGERVLQGLMGELILSSVGTSDLLACLSTSRQLRALASTSVKAVAPKGHFRQMESMAKRFPGVTDMTLDLSSEGLQAADATSLMSSLQSFRMMQHLSLRGLALSDAALPLLAASELPALSSLVLRGCSKVTWAGLGHLSGLPNLRHLNCSGIKYAGQDSCNNNEALHKLLANLNSLTMGDACTLSWVDDQLMGVVAQHAVRLRHLDCGGCIDLTDHGVSSVRRMGILQFLSLQSCVRLTNASVASVAELKCLQHLNIRGCLQINDAGMKQLSTLTLLESLDMSCCVGVQVLDPALFSCLRSLSSLNIASCSGLTSLAGLSVTAASLKDLNIASCRNLTLSSLEALSSLTSLANLDMSGCHNQAKFADGAVQLQRLSCLTNMQTLHLSSFRHPQGLPTGLLQAVAAMTGLRNLHMVACCPEAQPAPRSTANCTSDASAHSTAACDSGSQLWFLEQLTGLLDLDLSNWRHGTMQSLQELSGLSQLTRLRLQRWGNEATSAESAGTNCDILKHDTFGVAPVALCSKLKAQSQGNAQLDTADECPALLAPLAGAVGEDNAFRGFEGLSGLEMQMAAVNIHGHSRDPATRQDSYAAGSSDSDGHSSDDSSPSTSRAVRLAAKHLHQLVKDSRQQQQQQQQQGAGASTLLEQALAFLQGMSKLEVLDLEACLALDDACIRRLAHLSSLRHLHLAGCKRLQGHSFAALPIIPCLSLHSPSANTALTDANAAMGLPSISTVCSVPLGCGQLENLCLDDCPLIADHSLTAIAQLTSLRQLSLKGCRAVGDAGLEAVAAGLHRLSHLALFGAEKVSSRALEALAQAPNLKTLQLPHCWNVDDRGIRALKHSRSLMTLTVSHCWRLTNSAVADLEACKPMLTVTHCKVPVRA